MHHTSHCQLFIKGNKTSHILLSSKRSELVKCRSRIKISWSQISKKSLFYFLLDFTWTNTRTFKRPHILRSTVLAQSVTIWHTQETNQTTYKKQITELTAAWILFLTIKGTTSDLKLLRGLKLVPNQASDLML